VIFHLLGQDEDVSKLPHLLVLFQIHFSTNASMIYLNAMQKHYLAFLSRIKKLIAD
jgi:hypothetical protein